MQPVQDLMSQARRENACLIVISGKAVGKMFKQDEEAVIGRSDEAEIMIEDDGITGPDGMVGTADDGPAIRAWNLAPEYLGLPVRNGLTHVPDARTNYNLTNANPIQNTSWSSGSSFLRPLAIVPPRVWRIGAKLDW